MLSKFIPVGREIYAENDANSDNCIACGKGLYALTRGTVVSGRYEILDAIGKGGMRVVYKARDLELDEVVALKVMRGDLTGTSDAARRFRLTGRGRESGNQRTGGGWLESRGDVRGIWGKHCQKWARPLSLPRLQVEEGFYFQLVVVIPRRDEHCVISLLLR